MISVSFDLGRTISDASIRSHFCHNYKLLSDNNFCFYVMYRPEHTLTFFTNTMGIDRRTKLRVSRVKDLWGRSCVNCPSSLLVLEAT